MLKPLQSLLVIFLFSVPMITYAQQGPEEKLKAMGINLTTPSPPTANFVRAVRTGNLIFLSGHGPSKGDGTSVQGKLGTELTVSEGQEAARLTGIALLSSLKAEIGDLNKVNRIVKVLGMVNASPDFTQQPRVMNGFSDFMVEVFGEKGKHARSAVGMGSLPNNIAIEIEMIVEVAD
ncbi:Enamine deaminase RidA, house cleaning of reactive enamine intermediates, YjgF/YER057c/UK114 family [Cyclobacterium lianum]|uniref:Enamine deaminase RidA, house cleaning of reactive enamine intermediates, YjgF/YER057c/UK114 family n=1 Tax=Cyclobacterium lianum TaxID=388280 RepID=A0A1M7Q2D9_9BACT|nr:RidA family protein [Cyclobacterium lianum]SHN24278.1 Enamine deaminase RidA, house cleaning of reactive enamine intermediates, YjgF/YER057c/UK114 family [Cyclobacterium lianum]